MLILENVSLADLRTGTLLPGHHVAIEKEVIVEVSNRPIQAVAAQRFNLGGRCLLPGLIDAHYHATLTGLNRTLMGGFTTVRDMAGADPGLRAATANGTIYGPRLYLAGRVVADSIEATRAATREQLRHGVDHILVSLSSDDLLHSVEYAEEQLQAIVQEAESAGTYVAACAHTAESISRAVRVGVRTIEQGNLLNAEGAAAMAANNAFLIPTLISHLAQHRRGDLAAAFMSIERALAAGVALGFGTGLAGDLHPCQTEEFLLRAQIQPPHEVLRAATEVNAKIIGRPDELGVIRPGACADLIAVYGNPMRDLSVLQDQGARLDLIMKAGLLVKCSL